MTKYKSIIDNLKEDLNDRIFGGFNIFINTDNNGVSILVDLEYGGDYVIDFEEIYFVAYNDIINNILNTIPPIFTNEQEIYETLLKYTTEHRPNIQCLWDFNSDEIIITDRQFSIVIISNEKCNNDKLKLTLNHGIPTHSQIMDIINFIGITFDELKDLMMELN